VCSTTPPHSTLTLTLMTRATPSLVFCKVSIESTLTHMLLTLLQVTLQMVTSTTLLVIRVLHLMTQVCSTAHTFLFRWFVQLVRTPSSPKLASRPVTGLLLTHSLKEQMQVVVPSRSTKTVTTDVLQLRTSCDRGCCGAGCPTCPFRPPSRGVFFYANK